MEASWNGIFALAVMPPCSFWDSQFSLWSRPRVRIRRSADARRWGSDVTASAVARADF